MSDELKDLKAQAYELIVLLDQTQRRLNAIQQRILQLDKPKNMVEKLMRAEEKPNG